MAKKTEKKGVKGGKVIRSYTEIMPVRLTDAELLIAGRKLADAEREARDQEAKAASIKAELNSKKNDLDQNLRTLAQNVRNRSEDRDVLIQIEEDPKDHRFALHIRLDTEEVISRRPLSDAERQQALPLGEKDEQLRELASKAIRKKLDAADIRALAEKEKVDPEKLLAAVTEQQNKVQKLRPVEDPEKKQDADDAAMRVARKLLPKYHPQEDDKAAAALVADAAKEVGLEPLAIKEALETLLERVQKPKK